MLQNISINIANLINHWLQKEKIPEEHTTSRIVFIYKKSKLTEGNIIEDFRPLSITSIFFKIIKRTLKERIQKANIEGIIKINRNSTPKISTHHKTPKKSTN